MTDPQQQTEAQQLQSLLAQESRSIDTNTPYESVVSDDNISNISLLHHEAEALLHFDEAVASLPMEKKEEYLNAVAHGLVPSETDPIRYLRYSNFNAWAAAERICGYWKKRVDLFGGYKPLTLYNIQAGESALNEKDVLVLQAGYPAMLPTTVDGKPVILMDRSKRLAITDHNNRARAAWYIVSLLAKYDSAQQPNGVIVLVNVVQPRLTDVDSVFVHKSLTVLRDFLPEYIKLHFLCFLPLVPNENLNQKIADCISYYMKPRGYQPDLHFLNKGGIGRPSDDGGFLIAMDAIGIKPQGIPTFAGGTWSFDSVSDWIKRQALRECKQQLEHEGATNFAACLAGQGIKRKKGSESNTSEKNSHAKRGKTSSTANRRKNMNAIFSRQKRERRKRELEQLKSEHHQLRQSNAILKEENEFLESLKRQADKLVNELPTEQRPR